MQLSGWVVAQFTLFGSINISVTIQFSKIFVISLPQRTDKRDAIAVAASLTGFEFEWGDGVDGLTIDEKAIPEVL
jgi:hypothetical protein